MKLIYIILFLLFQVGSVGCWAETITSLAEITDGSLCDKYFKSGYLQRELYEHAVKMDERLGVVSDEKYNITLGLIGIISPLEIFPEDKHPSKGVWLHRFELTRGGGTRTYNVVFVAEKQAPPRRIPLIMGNTNTSPDLMADTLPTVCLAAKLRSKGSLTEEEFKKNLTISNSEVLGALKFSDPRVMSVPGVSSARGEKDKREVLVEKWTVKILKEEIPIVIQFIPDETGGGTTFVVLNEQDSAKILKEGLGK